MIKSFIKEKSAEQLLNKKSRKTGSHPDRNAVVSSARAAFRTWETSILISIALNRYAIARGKKPCHNVDKTWEKFFNQKLDKLLNEQRTKNNCIGTRDGSTSARIGSNPEGGKI